MRVYRPRGWARERGTETGTERERERERERETDKCWGSIDPFSLQRNFESTRLMVYERKKELKVSKTS